MKSLVYDPVKCDIEIKELSVKPVGPKEILLKVEMVGICGSDIVAWKGGFQRIKEPVVLGHEMVGTIVELGEKCDASHTVGDRVVLEPLDNCGVCPACKKGHYNVCENLKVYGIDKDGTFAEYIVVREDRVHKVSKQLSLEHCATCEPLSVAIHMVRHSGVQYGDQVVITGAGTIGILVGMLAKRSGADKIVITDMNEFRLSVAKDLGLCPINIMNENYLEEIAKELQGKKADVAFELVGVADSLNTCLEVTKSKGTVLIGGMFKQIPQIAIQKCVLKEVVIKGSRVYTYDDFEKAIKLLENGSLEIEKIITKVIDFENIIKDGMGPIKNGEEVLKVLVRI
jgi:2-desacetyl-2-hydroxyethyl bacteriochlorophyllide A dehydrogenase